MKYITAITLSLLSITLTGCANMSNFQAGRLPHAFASHKSERDPFMASTADNSSSVPHNSAAPRGYASIEKSNSGSSYKPVAHKTAYAPSNSKPVPRSNPLQMKQAPAPFQQTGYEKTAVDIPEVKNPFAKTDEQPPVLSNTFKADGIQTAHFEQEISTIPENKPDRLIQNSPVTENPFKADTMEESARSSKGTEFSENPFSKYSDDTANQVNPPVKTEIQHTDEQADSVQWRKSLPAQQKKHSTNSEKGFVLPSSFQNE